jgi:hypothetical protein
MNAIRRSIQPALGRWPVRSGHIHRRSHLSTYREGSIMNDDHAERVNEFGTLAGGI